jgi:hypothetical protein
MDSQEIRNLLETLKTIQQPKKQPMVDNEEYEILDEDLKGIIDKVKNKIAGMVGDKIAVQQHAETPSEEEQIQQDIEKKIKERLSSVYKSFYKDTQSAGISPTVKNVIQWLRKHPSIGDDETLAHAFRGIGIDASKVLQTPSKTPELDLEPEDSKEDSKEDENTVKIGDIKDGTKFIHSWIQPDGTERTSTGTRTGTNNVGQITVKWDSGSDGSLLPTDNVIIIKPEATVENNKERVHRLYSLLISAGKEFNGDDNDFKSILGSIIKDESTISDNDALKKTIDKFGKRKVKTTSKPEVEEIKPVKNEQEQKKEDAKDGKVEDENLKVFDKNHRAILKGQIVKVKLKRGNAKFDTFGKVIKLLRGEKNEVIIRVEFTGEDVGTATDEIWDIHAWELLRDPDRLVVFDTDPDDVKSESYKIKYDKMILETKYHFGHLLNDNDIILIETMINIALAEDEEVANDELSKSEILALFELLLYISVAKKKGFDYKEVTPKFKDEGNIESYLKRMYSRMMNTMKQYTSIQNNEKQSIFKEVYNKVINKLSGDLQKKVHSIAIEIIKKKKNYPLGIAFFTVLFTIISEQKNKDILSQYIERLYKLILTVKPQPTQSIQTKEPDSLGRIEPTF